MVWPCGTVFPSTPPAGHLHSRQTSGRAKQFKTFIGDTFGTYKMFLSEQKKSVEEGEETSEQKRLERFELHSAGGAKAAASRHLCSQAVTQVHEEPPASRTRFTSGPDVQSLSEKMEPASLDCNSLFLMLLRNIQRKTFGTTRRQMK